MNLYELKVNKAGRISSIRTTIVKSKISGKWNLLDAYGWSVFFHDRPSVVRKAKLYWFLYLTAEVNNLQYLDKLEELNNV